MKQLSINAFLRIFTISLMFLLIFSFTSCCTDTDQDAMHFSLSSSDSLDIINGVMASTDSFAEANNNFDVEKVTDFWQNSPDFVMVENTQRFADWNTIYNNCVNFYSVPLDSLKMVWVERNIIPITNSVAFIHGRYDVFIKFPSGKTWQAVPYYSALMTKVDNKWRALQGHESYDLIEE